MTRIEFQKLLQQWCIEDANGESGIEKLKRDVEFLEQELYHEYTVTAHGPHGAFGYRLAKWIGSADNEADQKILYSILGHLFFIGKKEQDAAYRTAYSKHIFQWLMKISNVDAFDTTSSQQLAEQVSKTRFTEITDSFKIRDFLTINNIQGENVRYRWKGNTGNWDPDDFRRTVLMDVNPQEITRTNIVLLEDFIGSGSQMLEAVELACSLGNGANILLCPLFICPVGARLASCLAKRHNNLTFSPVLEFDKRFFIQPKIARDEHSNFAEIRDCLLRIHHKISGAEQELGAFGYRKTGAIIVPASNCPDNTIPALHRRNDQSWEPLFLRNSREPI